MNKIILPKAALVTGGTSGVGLATARFLHEQGYAVPVTGQNPETLSMAGRSLPGAVVVLRADARVLADADRVAHELKERFQRLEKRKNKNDKPNARQK